MRPTLSTQHQSRFKELGKLDFNDYPFDAKKIKEAIEAALATREPTLLDNRDLWRTSEPLKQFLIRKLAPLALELLGKKSLRLLADQWIPDSFPRKGILKDLFGFQNLACVIAVGETLSIYEPSFLFPPDGSYFVLFGLDNAQYVKKDSDPANHFLKSQGYAFGDALKNDTHPLLYAQH